MKTSTVTNEIDTALVKFQLEMKPVKKDHEVKMKGTSKGGNDYNVNYEYAPLEVIQAQARPLLAKNGLHVTQFLSFVKVLQRGDETLAETIVTRIAHSSGQFYESAWPLDFTGVTKEQDRGSKITFNKRYSYAAALDIILENEDNDAVGVAARAVKSQDKIEIPSDPGEYVVSIGKKYKGMKFKDMKDFEISGFAKYLVDEAKKANKPMDAKATEFCTVAQAFLKPKQTEPKFNESEQVPF